MCIFNLNPIWLYFLNAHACATRVLLLNRKEGKRLYGSCLLISLRRLDQAWLTLHQDGEDKWNSRRAVALMSTSSSPLLLSSHMWAGPKTQLEPSAVMQILTCLLLKKSYSKNNLNLMMRRKRSLLINKTQGHGRNALCPVQQTLTAGAQQPWLRRQLNNYAFTFCLYFSWRWWKTGDYIVNLNRHCLENPLWFLKTGYIDVAQQTFNTLQREAKSIIIY